MKKYSRKSLAIALIVAIITMIPIGVYAAANVLKKPVIKSVTSSGRQVTVKYGKVKNAKSYVVYRVTTKDGKIVDAELISIKDSDFAKEYALKLLDTIVEKGTVEGVDGLSGATYTSRGVLDAVKEATAKASGN